MKKQYLVFAGLLVCSLWIAGCGKENQNTSDTPEATAAPTQSPAEGELVDMVASTEEEEEEAAENIIGTETETASQVTITNETGGEITQIYIRPYDIANTDYDWGEELVKGSFTLENGDKALYYFEEEEEDQLYDIRIAYAETDRNECFFRMLPLPEISQITLCMQGSGIEAVPYARYFDTDTQKEYSTLEDVLERLGLSGTNASDSSDGSGAEEGDTQQETEATPAPTQTPSDTETPAPTQAPSSDTLIELAKGCIGQSVDALYSAVGTPSGGSEYVNEPESGETGYYYYDTFTVSTTVDGNGNEVVAGVW